MLLNYFLFALFLSPLVILAEDYYEMFGIPKDADDRTIRKAFKKLAMQKHPDKNKVGFINFEQ